MAFQPDLVIYSATTLDIRLMEIHLCDMLRKHVDLKYEFLREAVRSAGVNDDDLRIDAAGEMINKARLKHKLRPDHWGVYDTTLGAIAAACRTAAVPIVMAITPASARPIYHLPAPSLLRGSRPSLPIKVSVSSISPIPSTCLNQRGSRSPPGTITRNARGHRRLFLPLPARSLKIQRYTISCFPASRSDGPKRPATSGRRLAARPQPQERREGPPAGTVSNWLSII